MTIDTRFFRAAVIYALVGMAGGIYMAASHDHSLTPAHAHWLLLGWVSMFLYGVFYRLFPTASRTLAAWHWWIANIGLIVMVAGIVIIYSGAPERGRAACVDRRPDQHRRHAAVRLQRVPRRARGLVSPNDNGVENVT